MLFVGLLITVLVPWKFEMGKTIMDLFFPWILVCIIVYIVSCSKPEVGALGYRTPVILLF